jgi:hypothetical protein
MMETKPDFEVSFLIPKLDDRKSSTGNATLSQNFRPNQFIACNRPDKPKLNLHGS